ncbi:O-antigen ligase [Arthrobacter sp. ISL-28]|uniref:O-antigen ligase family protein n=1 Tax=Arthrobacter sp. ISL-28 TaxID=2819108 RepID=UPI001BE77302|nr:O-antigen ligase family protein [Arthrobacter sp. ISL-28]MBT2519653.1 O-antigen ligase family protein [Arthrobacter sp. ISL-28]
MTGIATAAPRPPARAVDAVLFGFFVCDGVNVPGLPLAIPASDVAAIIMIGFAAFRRPQRSLGSAAWFAPLFIILLVYLAFGSMYNEVDWTRRAFRLAVMAVLVVWIVTGRIDIAAGLKGLGAGLVINAGLFYIGAAPNNYGGVLTGYLGDKNVAGLYYSLIPMLTLVWLRRRKYQVLCLSLAAFAVFLTGSRTAMAAFACGILWLVLSRHFKSLPRLVLVIIVFLTLQFVESNFAQVGIFSNREGSDILRERIENAAVEKSALAPWYGLGLGESYVVMESDRWFFHDSYLALYVEGGWIMLFSVLGLYLRTGLRGFLANSRSQSTIIIQAATLVLLVCASKLGEVFLSLPGFILIACAIINTVAPVTSRAARKVVGLSTGQRSNDKAI